MFLGFLEHYVFWTKTSSHLARLYSTMVVWVSAFFGDHIASKEADAHLLLSEKLKSDRNIIYLISSSMDGTSVYL